ncbi:MAG: hypothetical protein JRN09_00920 [Nitrososphaerota archaeon]|nr:hypothetical protein [Nitrososphaerota archaeon]
MSVNATSSISSATTSSTSQSLANFGPVIGSFAQQFASEFHVAVTGIDAAATLVAFYAGILLIPLGAILYWGHVSRYMGQSLLVGGVILVVLSYTLFPYLPSIAPP